MGLPGFTATSSLAPSAANYYGGRSLAFEPDELIQPEFLGVIRESFEHVGHSLSPGLSSLASSLANAIQNHNNNNGPNNPPFVCSQWVTNMIGCYNGAPTHSRSGMAYMCAMTNATNPENMALCASVSESLYSLVQQYCSEGDTDAGDLIGQVCQGD